jgi:dienelactone hydrolase
LTISRGRILTRSEFLAWSLDGSLQHYYLHLPQGVNRSSRIPLVIVEPYKTSHKPFFENAPTNPGALAKYAAFSDETKVAFIALFTRNQQLPDVSAEQDTMEALHHVQSLINVDIQLIYLAGECAGGRSALLMAEDHPDIFSGVSTIGAATGEQTMPADPRDNSGNVLLRLSNLSNTPVSLVHAESDFHSPTMQARLLIQRAKSLGFSPNLILLPGNGTFGPVEPVHAMLDFFRQLQNLPLSSPRNVSMTITEKLHQDVFWLHAEAPIVSGEAATASGEIAGDGKLTLIGRGISAITVDGTKLPESSRHRNLDVSYNGHAIRLSVFL